MIKASSSRKLYCNPIRKRHDRAPGHRQVDLMTILWLKLDHPHISSASVHLCYVLYGIITQLYGIIWNFLTQNIDDEHFMSMGITIHNYLHMNCRPKSQKAPSRRQVIRCWHPRGRLARPSATPFDCPSAMKSTELRHEEP